MSNTNLPPVAFEQTPEAWSNVANDYGEMMRLTNFTRMYSVDCLDQTIPVEGLKSGLRILDIAAGTGALSIAAAERVKDHGGHVVATDFSPEMINFLNKEIKKHPEPISIEAMVMDGQNLEFPDSSFDCAYSMFGLIFFPDQKRGLSEILRVLKPGGKVGIGSWSERSPLGALLMETLQKLAKEYPQLQLPAPPASVLSLSDPGRFESYLVGGGLKNVTIKPAVHTMRMSVAENFAFTRTNPVIGNIKAKLPEELKARFDTLYLQVLNEKFPSGEVVIEATANIGVGEK